MSVPEQVPYKEYRATGSNNSFEITFYLPDQKDLVVMVNKEIPLVGAYSIQGNTVVFSTPPNEGDLIELTRDTQLDRETNFKSYDNSFRPETINFDLDKIWLVLQESNLVDAKILARLKQEIEWRRTHDFNYDELAQVREKRLFDALKGYTDTLNAATNPSVFQGVVAGVVFAQDGKSIQTHLEEILEALAQERENIDSKADQTYVEEQLDLKANQDTTYSKTEVDSALDQKASKVDTYTKPEVDTALSAVAAGHKAYTTLALAQAAQGTLLANTIVEVTNDPTASNNGAYQWNGTTLTKSAYDPLSQAKADATTKANAAEANAKNYADALGSKIGYYQTENIFNPAQATAVGFYANGVPNGQAGSISALDYYPVNPGQKIWIRGVKGTNTIAVYDAAKSHIGVISQASAINGILTIAASYGSKIPAFIRISSYGVTTLQGIELGYGEIMPSDALAFGDKYGVLLNPAFYNAVSKEIISSENPELNNAIKEGVENLFGGNIDVYENLFNPNQELLQGYYNGTSYTSPSPAQPDAYISLEFIAVPRSRKFFAYGFGRNGNFIQLADINKQPIATIETSNVINGVYEVPAQAGSNNKDVHYVRFGSYLGLTAIRGGAVSIGYLSETASPPSIPPEYGNKSVLLSEAMLQAIIEDMNKQAGSLKGKKWVALGDSITNTTYSTYNYCDVLSNRYGATLVKHSANGATVHRKTPQDTQRILSESYIDIPTENPPDIITIAAGTNDLTTESKDQLGVMEDRTTSTFYGALHVLLSGLRNRFVDARIGYIAPIPRATRYVEGDPINMVWLKYKAIREVCAYYSIPVWNGYVEFGANPLDSEAWKTKYMPDGLHPNDLGHIWYANRIEDFILRIAR